MSTMPPISPVWIESARSAAPSATASSGWTALEGSLPKNSLIFARTSGMRLCPPTRSTSPTSEGLRPQLVRVSSQTRKVRSTRAAVSFSRSPRVTVSSTSQGLSPTMATKGTLICVVSRSESAILARSAASVMR